MDKDLHTSLLLDFYGPFLTKRQRDYMDLYLNSDFSLGEIAEQFGVSRQAVRDGLLRARVLLADADEKLGLLDRYYAQKKILDRMNRTADDPSAVRNCVKEINALWEDEHGL